MVKYEMRRVANFRLRSYPIRITMLQIGPDTFVASAQNIDTQALVSMEVFHEATLLAAKHRLSDWIDQLFPVLQAA